MECGDLKGAWMFWSAHEGQAVKGDVNFVGLLAPSLQIFAPEGCFKATVGHTSAPRRPFKYKKLQK